MYNSDPYNKLERYLRQNGGEIVKHNNDGQTETTSLSMIDKQIIIKTNHNSIVINLIAYMSFGKNDTNAVFREDREIIFVDGRVISRICSEGKINIITYNGKDENVAFDKCDISGVGASYFTKDSARESTVLQINTFIDFFDEILEEANIGLAIEDFGFKAYAQKTE